MTAMESLSLEGRRVGRGQLPPDLCLPRPPAWVAKALCPQVDLEMHFPEKGGPTRDAKRLCLSCPVQTECLQYALDNDERFGIWGGLSDRERRRVARGESAETILQRTRALLKPLRPARRLCDHCGEPFERNRGRFCRPECRYAHAHPSKTRPVVCRVCGGEFDGNGRSRYCSNECRLARRAEWQRDNRRRGDAA